MSAADLEPWLDRWGLMPDGEALTTCTARLLPVRRGRRRLMLKLITHPDEIGQGPALVWFDGRGAVRLEAREGAALLLQRAWPGRPLADLVFSGRDDEATGIVARQMMALHHAPAPGGGFGTVEDWGKGFERIGPAALAAGADAGLIDRAGRLHAELCNSQGERVLLHGDLQHWNILSDEGAGWLAIDPKGVIGERAYETGAMLRNPRPDPALYAEPAVIGRRASILAESLGLELDRVLGWCFAQAVLSGLWHMEDGQDASPAWRTAEATLALL